MYDAFINRYDLGQKHTRVTKMILNNKSVKNHKIFISPDKNGV